MSHKLQSFEQFCNLTLRKVSYLFSYFVFMLSIYYRGCQLYSFCHLKQYDKGVQELDALNFWMRKISILAMRKKN